MAEGQVRKRLPRDEAADRCLEKRLGFAEGREDLAARGKKRLRVDRAAGHRRSRHLPVSDHHAKRGVAFASDHRDELLELDGGAMVPDVKLGLSALALLVIALSSACPRLDKDNRLQGEPSVAPDEAGDGNRSLVTPVTGPSWLDHLGLDISETRLGQMGESSAQPGPRGEEPDLAGRLEVSGHGGHGLRAALRRVLALVGRGEDPGALVAVRFQLTGADLYRLSCRACHGPDGEGAPPEIASLLDPVRATSPELTQERMEARGTPIDQVMAAELASQAETMLRTRLQEGGEKMPPFQHLRGDEVEALLGYLQELAGVEAGMQAEALVDQSAARVGEHLVKGTCHLCHDAVGAGGPHEVMMAGIVPSLQSFPTEYSLDSVLYKVEHGSSGMMGMMRSMHRNQEMPAFPFLSPEEVAAGYLYLREYPPTK